MNNKTIRARLGVEHTYDECALTPENLCLLGAYDEASSLYEEILDIHKSFLKEKSYVPGLSEKCLPQVKKLINRFFKEKTNLFTDEYPILYVKYDYILRRIRFMEPVHVPGDPHGLHFRMKTMTKETFFERLLVTAAMLVHSRRRNEGVYDTLAGTYNQINNRISLAAAKAWSDRKIGISGSLFECPQLHIFKVLHKSSCIRLGHEVVPAEHTVFLSGKTDKAVRLPVHYCKECRKRFIGYESYRIFTGEYGILIFERIPDEGMDEGEFLNFQTESQLHRHGYNVVAGLLSEKERQNLLETLLRRRIMTYSAICRDIEFAIKMFIGRERYADAVRKWRDDLLFLGNLVLQNKEDLFT